MKKKPARNLCRNFNYTFHYSKSESRVTTRQKKNAHNNSEDILKLNTLKYNLSLWFEEGSYFYLGTSKKALSSQIGSLCGMSTNILLFCSDYTRCIVCIVRQQQTCDNVKFIQLMILYSVLSRLRRFTEWVNHERLNYKSNLLTYLIKIIY